MRARAGAAVGARPPHPSCPEKEKDAWESLVVDFAKHVCEEALPAVNRGWGFPLSAWTLVATVVALASIVLAPGLGGTRLAVHA